MFERVLIANRGEIAVRIERTLRRLGVESVAVYQRRRRRARRTCAAPTSPSASGPTPGARVLPLDRAGARRGADAAAPTPIHPGYGFLSERRRLRRRLRRRRPRLRRPGAGGDGAARRQGPGATPSPKRPGCRSCPGWQRRRPERRGDRRAGRATGDLPLLVKAAAGGGGKGMRVVARRERPGRGARRGAARGGVGVRRRPRC